MVSVIIDGFKVEVPENSSVLDAAKKASIDIPTLCYLKGANVIGACRICLIEVVGNPTLQAACCLPVTEGMEVLTASEKVMKTRRATLDLILSNHDRECLTCVRNQNCELQRLANDFHITKIKYDGERLRKPLDENSVSVIRDPNKCVLCKRCIAACGRVQGIGAIGTTNRGFKTMVEPVWRKSLVDVPCINCGQCITSCPVGALTEKTEIENVFNAIHDPDLHVVVQPAPSIRVALGEEFGMPMGTRVTGKLAAALRKLGFDKIFDTDFGADLTIMEEGYELINRIQNGGKLPQITSCSPGWVRYAEFFYPDMLENLSSCKSPHQMLGAIIKSYYAEQNNIDPAKIYTVSVMPCTAKKYEKNRQGQERGEYRDVDAVITTRELASMIKEANIDFVNLPDEDFDDFYGTSSGAAAIFGASGGVMEAALRTVADVLTGEDLPAIEYKDVRGIAGIKEAEVKIGDLNVRVAVASGTANAKRLLDEVKSGEKEYHFIEIMACPGGCVTGGGQPIVSARIRNFHDPRIVRAHAIYREDEHKTVRKSHQNPDIIRLYDEYLEKPNSHKAHELLHTFYSRKDKYSK